MDNVDSEILKAAQEIVVQAISEAYVEIENAFDRQPTDAEKAIISCALTFSLVHMFQEPSYRFPNVIGRASAIFAFLIIVETFNQNDIPALRRALGLSQRQVADSVHKAVDKDNDEEYFKSSIRAVIIGTRLAVYSIVGMDRENLHLLRCKISIQLLTSKVGFAHLPANVRADAVQLINFMGNAMENGAEDTFNTIFSVS